MRESIGGLITLIGYLSRKYAISFLITIVVASAFLSHSV